MIIPRHAARIWVEDTHLCLSLPGTGEASHCLRLPVDEAGLRKALSLLSARTPASRIGEPGDLTQYQIDRQRLAAIAKAVKPKGPKPKFTEEQGAKARDVLRQLGMI